MVLLAEPSKGHVDEEQFEALQTHRVLHHRAIVAHIVYNARISICGPQTNSC